MNDVTVYLRLEVATQLLLQIKVAKRQLASGARFNMLVEAEQALKAGIGKACEVNGEWRKEK